VSVKKRRPPYGPDSFFTKAYVVRDDSSPPQYVDTDYAWTKYEGEAKVFDSREDVKKALHLMPPGGKLFTEEFIY